MHRGYHFIRSLITNPVLIKDLRTSARRPKFLTTVLLASACSGLAVLVGSLHFEDTQGLVLFGIIFVLQCVVLIFMIPSEASTAISGERRANTFNLLYVTALSPWEIAWGKFAAPMTSVLVLLAGCLPVVALTTFYKGLGPFALITAYVYLLLASAASAAFSVMVSSLCRDPLVSTLACYAVSPVFFVPGILDACSLVAHGGPAFPIAYMVAVYVCVILLASLFFIASACSLMPPSFNRSTPLRIWYAAYAAAWLLGAMFMQMHVLAFFLGGCLIPAVIGSVGFCTEPAELSERVAGRLDRLARRFGGNGPPPPHGISPSEWLPAFIRPFLPGRVTAGLFVRVVFLAMNAGGLFLTPLASLVGLLCYPFVRFCCVLGETIAAWDQPARCRKAMLLVIGSLILLPLVFLVSEWFSFLAGISPLGLLLAMDTSRLDGILLDGFPHWIVHLLFYLGAAFYLQREVGEGHWLFRYRRA